MSYRTDERQEEKMSNKIRGRARFLWKPALLLMLITPLAEAVSGAASLPFLFSSGIFISYVLFLYGLPILIIREIAVRKQFGLIGLGCLGLIYGLYNEGVFALTIFSPLDVPVEVYESYGLIGDIRLPFTLFILPWHALISVTLPILIVHYIFRTKATQPWLSKKVTWALGGTVLCLAILTFFGVAREKDEYIHDLGRGAAYMALMLVAAGLLWLAANKWSRVLQISTDLKERFSWQAFASGVLLFALVDIVPYVLASVAFFWPVAVLYSLALGVVVVYLGRKRKSVSLDKALTFALGAGTGTALLTLTANPLSGILFVAIFITLLVRIKRK